MKVGIISDTHGLLRPSVFDVFGDVEHILHAGDIGDPDILTELEAIAPVTAVQGNTDDWEIAELVPEVARTEIGGVSIVVVHGHRLRSATPAAAAEAHPDAGLVVFGHSHQPIIQKVGDVLAVNPGSAGPRRFRHPVSVAIADIANGAIDARIIELQV